MTAGGGLVVLCVFMELTGDLPVLWFLPCILTAAMIMFLIMRMCINDSAASVGHKCVGAFILAEFAASLEWQMYCFISEQLGSTSTFLRWGVLVIVYAAVFGGATIRILYFIRSEMGTLEVEVTSRELWTTVAIGAAIYALSNLSYVEIDTPFSGEYASEIFNIRTLVDLGGVILLHARHLQLVELRTMRERNALHNVLQTQYVHYQQSQESIELINRKYHDLKHQIAVLRAEVNTEKKNAYLDQMEEEIKAYEAQNKTGNQVLDTVLTSKSLYCQQHNINLTSVVDGTLLNFMDEMDLCTLFGNALDNAIESVEKVQDTEKRLIHLSVARQKAFVHIRLENTYAGELKFEGGLPVTTKADSRNHGYGLKSIRQTAQNMAVLLPLPQKDSGLSCEY